MTSADSSSVTRVTLLLADNVTFVTLPGSWSSDVSTLCPSTLSIMFEADGSTEKLNSALSGLAENRFT